MLDDIVEVNGATGLGPEGTAEPCELCDLLEAGPCCACNASGWRRFA